MEAVRLSGRWVFRDEVRRFKQLEEESRQLKQLVADLSLDKSMLQEVASGWLQQGVALNF